MTVWIPSVSSDRSTRKRLRYRQWIWIAWWIALAVALHLPRPAVEGRSLPVSDKVIHFGLFFVLVALGAIALRARSARADVGSLIGWGVAYLIYAALDEWSQGFVGRDVQFGDYVANAAGVITATFIAVLMWPSVRSHEGIERTAEDAEDSKR